MHDVVKMKILLPSTDISVIEVASFRHKVQWGFMMHTHKHDFLPLYVQTTHGFVSLEDSTSQAAL